MREFQSQLEQLLATKELLFDATPGFGRYKPFLEQAIAHPAKMNTRLTEYLIKNLTKEGDLILDPMSGSGLTGVVATLLGRDAICVELEEKFYKWQLDAKAKVEASSSLSVRGKMSCVLGDARKLGGLLQSADVIVTSPPYGNSKKGDEEEDRMANNLEKHGLTEETRRNRHTPGRLRAMKSMVSGYSDSEENIGNLPLGEIDAVVTSPPYSSGGWKADEDPANPIKHEQKRKLQYPMRPPCPGSYSPNPNNIGNLSYGKVDAVITSPPYGDAATENRKGGILNHPENCRCNFCRKNKGNRGEIQGYRSVDAVITSPPYAIDPKNVCHTKEGKTLEEYDKKRGFKPIAHQRIAYSTNPENIGHLPLGNVDAVITSPPYEESLGSKHHSPRADKISKEKSLSTTYTERAKVDVVITSPPYEDTQHFHDIDFMKKITEDQNKKLETGLNTGHAKSVEAANRSFGVMAQGSLENEKNIGNLKKETYLEAMLKVYAEMWKVLKTDGLAIIVVKPFIRNKKVVDLPYQTWLLMQKCDFKLTKLFKLRLTQQSFWRILYQKKHPEVDVIAHEYVLVCQK